MELSNTQIASIILDSVNFGLEQAQQTLGYLMAENKSLLIQGLIESDEKIGYCVRYNKSEQLEAHLNALVHHQAWKMYFDKIWLYERISNSQYYRAIANYIYSNVAKREYYGQRTIKEGLIPFTLENVAAFDAEWLTVDETVHVEALTSILYRTARNYGDWNTEFKKRNTLKESVKNGIIHSARVYELANFMQAVKHFKKEEVSTNYNGELRKELFKRSIVEAGQYELDADVSIIFKDSGSIELRLTDSLAKLLNQHLPETV